MSLRDWRSAGTSSLTYLLVCFSAFLPSVHPPIRPSSLSPFTQFFLLSFFPNLPSSPLSFGGCFCSLTQVNAPPYFGSGGYATAIGSHAGFRTDRQVSSVMTPLFSHRSPFVTSFLPTHLIRLFTPFRLHMASIVTTFLPIHILTCYGHLFFSTVRSSIVSSFLPTHLSRYDPLFHPHGSSVVTTSFFFSHLTHHASSSPGCHTQHMSHCHPPQPSFIAYHFITHHFITYHRITTPNTCEHSPCHYTSRYRTSYEPFRRRSRMSRSIFSSTSTRRLKASQMSRRRTFLTPFEGRTLTRILPETSTN